MYTDRSIKIMYIYIEYASAVCKLCTICYLLCSIHIYIYIYNTVPPTRVQGLKN